RASRSCRASTTSAPTRPRSATACTRSPRNAAPSPSQLLDDAFRLVAGECAERLGLLRAVVAELRDDLERRVIVRSLEDLDHVVATERHLDADELSARLLDLPLAVLDPVAPGRQAEPPLRRPAHERDVVRHARIFSGCV